MKMAARSNKLLGIYYLFRRDGGDFHPWRKLPPKGAHNVHPTVTPAYIPQCERVQRVHIKCVHRTKRRFFYSLKLNKWQHLKTFLVKFVHIKGRQQKAMHWLKFTAMLTALCFY